MAQKQETYLKTQDVAARLNVSTKTINRWIHKKGLPAVKIFGVVRIPEKEFNRWVEFNTIRCNSRGARRSK
jgi:excisionase family DNA binding protein